MDQTILALDLTFLVTLAVSLCLGLVQFVAFLFVLVLCGALSLIGFLWQLPWLQRRPRSLHSHAEDRPNW